MSGALDGRVALVTGAGGGIGRAVASRLASQGAAVVAADLNIAGAKETAAALASGGAVCAATAADVRQLNQVESMVTAAIDEFGKPADIVVANAGHQTFASIEALTEGEWRSVMDVNALGTFYTARAGIEQMMTTGVTGSVVCVASIQGRLGSVYYAHYAASKAAILSLAKSLALWAATNQIRVNAVAPGIVETELWARADRELAALRGVQPGVPRAERIAQVPLKRLALRRTWSAPLPSWCLTTRRTSLVSACTCAEGT